MNRLDQLLEALQDTEDVERSVAAVDAISKEAEHAWLPKLKQVLLSGEDFFIREAVAAPVAKLMGITALASLLEAKKLGEAETHDNDSLVAVICDLVEEFPSEAIDILAGLAKSQDSADRVNAAWLFEFVRGDDSMVKLKCLLHDANPAVVSTAIRSLGSIGSAEALLAIHSLPFFARLKHRQVIKSATTE